MARLGDICIINPKSPEFDNKHLVSFVPMQKVTESGEIDASECKEYNEVKKGFTYFQENDVLFAKITPCMENGKGAVATALKNGVGFGSTEFHVLRPISELSDSKWLYYVTVWDVFRKECEKNMTGSAGQKRVPKSFIENFEISLPSLSEQRYMASVLDKISNLIALRKQQLDKLDELVKARFVEMFGDLNINDKGWQTEPLGQLCDISRGGSPRPIEQYLGGTVPWIKISDATAGDRVYLTTTKEHIIESGVKKSRYVKKGSLIFANCGVSLGFARIITFDGCIHDGWLAFENISERLDKVFLLSALNQMTEHFRRIAPAGTQPNLNTSIMSEYNQIVPPIENQKDFVKFYGTVDYVRLTIQQGLDKLEVLKNALMQEYFG